MQSSSDGWIVSGRGGKPVPIDTYKLKNIGKVMMLISWYTGIRLSANISYDLLKTLANWHKMWHKNVGESTQVVGELTVGEMTRWRNDRNSCQQQLMLFLLKSAWFFPCRWTFRSAFSLKSFSQGTELERKPLRRQRMTQLWPLFELSHSLTFLHSRTQSRKRWHSLFMFEGTS